MDFITNYGFEIMREVINLRQLIDEVSASKEEREIWYMTIAADFLHDVSEKDVDAFLANYKVLKSEVCDLCGEEIVFR